MLNLSKENDKKIMMKYRRTNDMIRLLEFFPDLSPVKDLTIVTSYEDYLKK